MKKRSPDPEQVVQEMLASDLMDQTQKSLPLNQLKDKWVIAFKAWRNTGDSKKCSLLV